MSEPLISSYLNLPVFLHFLLNPFKAIGIIELEIKKMKDGIEEIAILVA